MKIMLTILFVLVFPGKGIGKEIQPLQFLSKQEGTNVTLQCGFPSPEDLSNYTFDFKVVDENFTTKDILIDLIYIYNGGKEHDTPQMPEFINRTYLSYEDLRKGIASITITQLRMSDRGNYKCLFPIPTLLPSCRYTLTVVEKNDSNTNSPSKEATPPEGGAQWRKPVAAAAAGGTAVIGLIVLIAKKHVWLRHHLTAISERFRSRNHQPNSPETTPMNGSQPMDEHENTNGSPV